VPCYARLMSVLLLRRPRVRRQQGDPYPQPPLRSLQSPSNLSRPSRRLHSTKRGSRRSSHRHICRGSSRRTVQGRRVERPACRGATWQAVSSATGLPDGRSRYPNFDLYHHPNPNPNPAPTLTLRLIPTLTCMVRSLDHGTGTALLWQKDRKHLVSARLSVQCTECRTGGHLIATRLGSCSNRLQYRCCPGFATEGR